MLTFFTSSYEGFAFYTMKNLVFFSDLEVNLQVSSLYNVNKKILDDLSYASHFLSSLKKII
jgi:hypothetical protein